MVRKSSHYLSGLEPSHAFIVTVGMTVLAVAARPISDIDTFWHVLIGQEILARHSIHNLGNSWALFGSHQGWETTQWLSEVGMYTLHRSWGWRGIAVATLVISAVIMVGLVLTLAPHRPAPVAALVFSLEALPLTFTLVSRPQTISYVFIILLGYWIRQRRNGQSGPHYLFVGIVVFLWANLHGYWVLAPAFFGLCLVGALTDAPTAWRTAVRSWGPLVLTSLVAGCLTPLGPAALEMPLRFHAASAQIYEWGRTALFSPYAFGLLLLVLASTWAWARSDQPIPRSEVVLVLGALIYALVARRDVSVAALVIGPTVADRLAMQFPRRSAVSQKERRALVAASIAVLVLVGGFVVYREISMNPLSGTTPLKIAAYLHDVPGDKRIMNDYNAAGPLLAYGSSGIQLAIDGRADRDGAQWIAEYQGAMQLMPGWERVLARVKPDFAVLLHDAPLTHVLEVELGWREIMKDGNYVLLSPGA